MARPTDEVKKHHINIRLTETEYESLGENKSERIRELIHKGSVIQNEDSFVIQNNNVTQNYSDDIITSLNDIEEMVVCSGGTLEKFLNDLDIKLTWDTLKLKNGEIDVSALGLSEELDNLKNACEEKGVPMDEAIRKTAQRIWGIRQ